jgi:hypothetical protein
MNVKITDSGQVHKPGGPLEDIPTNEVLLAQAAASRENFHKDVRSMIESIPEKPNGESLLTLASLRESTIKRGYIPTF